MTSSKNLIQASAGVGGGDFYPYTVDYSARFNDVDSAYLYTTLSTATDSKVFCVSTWLKRGDLGEYSQFFGAGVDAFNRFGMRFDSSDRLEVFTVTASTDVDNIRTTRVFRDPSAWMHIFFVQDTTEGTASDRWKIFINGVQETSFDTTNYPTSNATTYANAAYVHYIGTDGSINYFYSGYQSEVVMIDGTAYAPTDFAEDKNGIWIPKDPSGLTFGTNGFYLDFSNSGALGTDSSGNSNNWTVNGLTSSDQMPDTPTNNFATLNPLLQFPYPAGYYGAMYNGNLEKYGAADNSHTGAYSTIAMSPNTGKWYSEHYVVTENRNSFGISYAPTDAGSMNANDSNTYGYYLFCYSAWGYSILYAGLTTVETVTNLSAGEIVGILYDSDNLEVTFFVNGTQAGSTMSVPSATYLFFADGYGVSPRIYNVSNFGQDSTFGGRITAGGNTDANDLGDFKYTVPTDALSLCTANLPEPTIGPNSDIKPDEVFAPILYTGNGTSQSISTLEFQPDFTWIKDRDTAYNHMLFDALRGATKYLNSNTINAEATDAQSLSSFNSNGFSVGNNAAVNANAEDYVAWNWKANGSGVTNTDGSVTATVSVNQDAGISIATFNAGTGTTDRTFGHGLGVTPACVLMKARTTAATDWWVWHKDFSNINGYLYLQLNSSERGPDASLWGNSGFTSTTCGFRSNYTFVVSDDIVAYSFAEIESFSSFGKYTGNGSDDGSFIYTGFRPAFVIVKSLTTAYSWMMHDSVRSPGNMSDEWFYANYPNAEETGATIGLDLLSNGFKIRTTNVNYNDSGQTFIYMAFAENPFKYSNAR